MKIHKATSHVISGKESGKSGKVLRVDKEKRRVVIEVLNIARSHAPEPKKNPQGAVWSSKRQPSTLESWLVCPALTASRLGRLPLHRRRHQGAVCGGRAAARHRQGIACHD